MSVGELTGDALARACAEAMLERDHASRSLGIVLEEARPGYARASLLIGAAMVNGHAIAHGGITFTLADSTFAFACNSRNEPNVALQASISYIAAVRLGERLVAEGHEQSSRGRTGRVRHHGHARDGELVALFRGTCYRIKGTVLEGASS